MSSARHPGDELRTGHVLLLGCGTPVAGCSPAAHGVTTAARRLARKPAAAAAGSARRGRVGMERERAGERRGEEEDDDMWGPRVSDRGDEVYVFVYACSWVQVVFIRIE